MTSIVIVDDDDAGSALATALEQLRELAAGLDPAVPSDRGLVAAPAARCPVTVDLPVDHDLRCPAPAEAAERLAVAEALANVARHAGASEATEPVSHRDGRVAVAVADDRTGEETIKGVGASGGSALRALGDRVEAPDRTFPVACLRRPRDRWRGGRRRVSRDPARTDAAHADRRGAGGSTRDPGARSRRQGARPLPARRGWRSARPGDRAARHEDLRPVRARRGRHHRRRALALIAYLDGA